MLIKFDKATEEGNSAGIVYINPEQVVAVYAGQGTTEIQMVDGRPRWVKEAPEEVVARLNAV